MSEMIGFCGLICTYCPTYIATQNNDQKEREKVAEEWSRLFKSEIKPQDINCDSCVSDSGKTFTYCSICLIRKCGKEKGVINCAYCNDYPCNILTEWFTRVPESKVTLERVHNTL